VLVLPPLLLWLGVSVLVILLVVSFRWVRRQGLEGFWPYLFITSWAFIPFAAITVIGLFYPIFQFKQFLIIVAPLLVWAVWLSKSMPSRLGSLFLAALFVSSSVSLVYQQVTLTKDDWRGASSYIQENFSSGDIVYANPAASSLAFSLYWDKPLPFRGYPPNYDIVSGGWDGIVLTSRIAEQELEAAAQGHSRIWLVELFPQLWDPDQTLPGWLSQHGQLLEDKNFGTIHLRLYQLTNNR
jgi:hypothetical protein